MKRPVEYVNTFIGTQGSGHALIGPQTPRGMVKLGPDNLSLPNNGYDYLDHNIIGFVHLHQEGAGGRGGRGNILFMPVQGELQTDEREYYSPYSHGNEESFVGYYRVFLERYKINAELAATDHCGLHRYTFERPGENRVLIDLAHTLGGYHRCTASSIKKLSDRTVCGCGEYLTSDKKFEKSYKVYFHAEFSRPFASCGTWSDGAVSDAPEASGKLVGGHFDFPSKKPLALTVRVGISYVSCEQAAANIACELAGKSFDRVVNDCRERWNELLSRIDVRGGKENETEKFYSAFYRANNAPININENGFYAEGASGVQTVHESARGFYSEDWALWDTARTTHPLAALTEPEHVSDMAETFIQMYREGGWLPMATAPADGVPEVMIGHHANSVILDAYVHGCRDFDAEEAFAAMKKCATQYNPDFPGLGTPEDYIKLGYYPEDGEVRSFSCSRTLEVCYADWCVAEMARLLGHADDEKYFRARAKNYLRLFDPETRFIRPRYADGSWFTPFNPADSFKNGFCECTSWEYTFYVPHDIEGLISHIGGREEFIRRLDEFFASGLFNYENETSIQVPFLYSYAGAPYRTAEIVRDTLTNKYWNTPNGLHGEDDAGAMSAWYVLAACGLYPVCPGDGRYVLSTPLFPQVDFRVGKSVLKISCKNYSDDNIYIKSARLNGRKLDVPFITWEQLSSGGKLELLMTSDRLSGWGSDYGCDGTLPALSDFSAPDSTDGDFELRLTLRNDGEAGTVRLTAEDGGTLIGESFVALGSGETASVSIPCRVYEPGRRELTVNEAPALSVFMTGNRPAALEFGKPALSAPFAVYGSGKTLEARVSVKNAGGAPFSGSVPLMLDGRIHSKAKLSLAPGRESELIFPVRALSAGTHLVKVGDSTESELDVAAAPGPEWTVCATTPSQYYTAGEHVYIRAEGDNDKPEFGILFRTEPVSGDFDAVARVSYEELTCPYAPAAIIVKNTLEPGDLTAAVYGGAMSKRGFCFVQRGGEYIAPYTYAPGCPETPYYFKLTKRGKDFMNYYSRDGIDWIQHSGVRMESAAEAQYVGLLCNAGCPVARLVRFDWLKIEKK